MDSNKNQTNEEEIVHISSQLSSKMIVELIEKYPNLKKITCPPSLYNRISDKYLEALEELGITVEINHNWNTKIKYTDYEKKTVYNMIKEGKTPLKISNDLNIPIKTIYYLKDSYNKKTHNKIHLKRGKKKKYNMELREKIKKLQISGISPKEISKKENIPLRTVYYILKNG
ncbi:MAG: resolvase [Methanobrevibacter sp.]|nr:resolvase [Methanobrevibacter sp.]